MGILKAEEWSLNPIMHWEREVKNSVTIGGEKKILKGWRVNHSVGRTPIDGLNY